MPSNNDPSNKQKQSGSGIDRGFAAMDEEKRREASSRGGKASHGKGGSSSSTLHLKSGRQSHRTK